MTEAQAAEKAAEKIQGNLSTFVLNGMIAAFNATNPPQQLPPLDETGLPVGLAFYLLGKQNLFGGIGVRNFVVKDTYDLFAGILFQATAGQSENALGDLQEEWLRRKLQESESTWRFIGNSTSFTTLIYDLRELEFLPALFRQRFYLNADQWDGFPNKRRELLALFGSRPNTLMLAGDIHQSHTADHGNGLVEFTVTSISSSTFKNFLRTAVLDEPFNGIAGTNLLVENFEALVLEADAKNEKPHLRYTRGDVHGFAVVSVSAARVETTFYHIHQDHVQTNHYENPGLGNLFSQKRFAVQNGELRELF